MLRQFFRNLISEFPHFAEHSISDSNLIKDGFQFIPGLCSQDELSEIFPNLLPNIPNDKYLAINSLIQSFSASSLHKLRIRGLNSPKNIDKGMYDVLLSTELNKTDRLYYKAPISLLKMLDNNNIIPGKYKFSFSNLYIYKNCISPRCLHIDSLKSQHIKVFLYLSDCTLDDGPYAYVRKSHRRFIYNRMQFYVNKKFGSDLGNDYRDGTFYSSHFATKFQVQRGDVLLSDQRGIHGDMVCKTNGVGKFALVLNFLPR